jgi:hypothetical protein
VLQAEVKGNVPQAPLRRAGSKEGGSAAAEKKEGGKAEEDKKINGDPALDAWQMIRDFDV